MAWTPDPGSTNTILGDGVRHHNHASSYSQLYKGVEKIIIYFCFDKQRSDWTHLQVKNIKKGRSVETNIEVCSTSMLAVHSLIKLLEPNISPPLPSKIQLDECW